ncbi:MAG: serine/threonine-protein kinase [Chloroflexota bacterium]
MEGFTQIGTELCGKASCYLLEREIARGGMGAIYQGKDVRQGRVVAIKEACLDPEICKDRRDQIRERLVHEMEVLLPLDSPNLPKIYDQFSSRYNEYLVMEYVEGCTLMQVQQRTLGQGRLLEESRVLGWALQALEALNYLHTRPKPVIHRDIKPENLILTPDGRVVLVDFGLMKQVERQTGETDELIKAVGTVEYAPPEQYSEMDWGTDARSDLYSLGATLYYLLAGTLPPRAIERIMPGSVNLAYKLPSLRQLNATLSPLFELVIFKALEVDPGQRYQSAAQMRAALFPRRRFIILPF